MTETTFTKLEDLQKLFNLKWNETHKIEAIRMLRNISGEGLRETKDFHDRVVTMLHIQADGYDPNKLDPGDELHVVGTPKPEEGLNPPKFMVGHTYKQVDGNNVVILGTSNANTSFETVYSIDSKGNCIHRYNRRDFGLCTGTDHFNPDPRNLINF